MSSSVFATYDVMYSLEGCVVWLQHGLVSEYGGATSCAKVSGISVDVVGRRAVKFVHSLEQKLLPIL